MATKKKAVLKYIVKTSTASNLAFPANSSTIDSFIERLTALRSQFGGSAKLTLMARNWSQNYKLSIANAQVSFKRPETDAELQERIRRMRATANKKTAVLKRKIAANKAAITRATNELDELNAVMAESVAVD